MYPVKGASLARLDLLDIDLIPADEMRARALAERARFAVLHRGVGAAAVLAPVSYTHLVIPICAKTGEGVDEWADWLRAEVKAWRG